ncbi:trithorax group osa-like [Olea europaea subsp. europaea]|uniref:Trithorax group osa-like n=1 Tax=Olea europaea subsp. europaea TaxID=158383 RepID=A0A8S0SAH6_OLEEU|nr:trithorax group osa-like [Olea europaea subsp. europaea]
MGFDTKCIIDANNCPMEYFCPVCCTLVYPHEALQSRCSHLYCKPCLSYITTGSRTCPYDGYLVAELDSKPLMESDKVLAQNIGRVKGVCQTQQASEGARPQVQFSPQVQPKIRVSAQPLAPNYQGNPQQMQPHTQIQPHARQEVSLVQHRPVMQPLQEYLPHQSSRHQPFLAPVQIQLHQLGRIPLEKPLWPQVCPYPYSPPSMMQKNVEAQPESLLRQSQSYDGRHVMPVKCSQSQAFTQSSVVLGSMAQVRPMQLGLTQPYAGQSYSKSTVLEKIRNPVSENFRDVQEVGSSSQKIVEKDSIRK